jgi:hypothetical protein
MRILGLSLYKQVLSASVVRRVTRASYLTSTTTTSTTDATAQQVDSDNTADQAEIIKQEQDDEEDVRKYYNSETGESYGPRGPEPTRFGDWERNGRCFDF